MLVLPKRRDSGSSLLCSEYVTLCGDAVEAVSDFDDVDAWHVLAPDDAGFLFADAAELMLMTSC